jgi:hypothetical protein
VKRSAFDCLRRGLANLRANWELVPLRWGGMLAVGLLVLAGLLPPLLVLGGGLLSEGFRGLAAKSPDAWAQLATRIGERLPAVVPAFAVALVGTLAIWLFACIAFCYLQAGIFGVLTAAERQALPAADRPEWFRTFSLPHFLGWGGRYMWRFFGFAGLFGAVWIGVMLAFVLWAFLLVGGGERWGKPAALGIGCGGLVPLVFLVVVVALWGLVSQADLAREGAGSGVWSAAAHGLRVLGARFGAVSFLFLLFVFGAVALALVGVFLGFALTLALSRAPLGLSLVLRFSLSALQSLAGSALALALAAALVALVQGELPRARRAEVAAA